ncbi:jg14732 [Pararge aegeria aegeria]|uniref:Jg14732 protein n=1 Tax=Pararge aegeria aegeria TaxID=348720 RepID=A0A8S4SNM0_9NEOP|nr:jg14732 [Pararge aegeria aegeria]
MPFREQLYGPQWRGRSPMRWMDQVKASIEAPPIYAQERQPLEKSGEGLQSEPQYPDDDHDLSVKTVTTKKKIRSRLERSCPENAHFLH